MHSQSTSQMALSCAIALKFDLDKKDKFGQTAREVIQKRNSELYSQLDEYTRNVLQLQGEQEIIESYVIGSSEDSSCCIIF